MTAVKIYSQIKQTEQPANTNVLQAFSSEGIKFLQLLEKLISNIVEFSDLHNMPLSKVPTYTDMVAHDRSEYDALLMIRKQVADEHDKIVGKLSKKINNRGMVNRILKK